MGRACGAEAILGNLHQEDLYQRDATYRYQNWRVDGAGDITGITKQNMANEISFHRVPTLGVASHCLPREHTQKARRGKIAEGI